MLKQIPNIFTLANLFLGCIAIVYILQPGLTLTVSAEGDNLVVLPERMMMASWFIVAAAVVDFFDGFVARALHASSELGKQLDSLADVVSFGVAPGMIVLQFLRLSYSQEAGGLDTSIGWLLPALLIPCAGAYRLGRFNIDTSQQHGFKGVPIPAAGIFIASFPLFFWYASDLWIINLLENKFFWYGIIVLISYLMISTLPMLAMKFKSFSVQQLLPFILILLIGGTTGLFFGWLAVPIGFFAYVGLSLIFKQSGS
jgi:CDP-diacylglycerol--serine O-phosphatidyltransferase